jgi:aspartate racemase
MTRHIGIVGCSAEGAALCYRTICLEAEPLMGRHAHPEITLHTIALAGYMQHLSDHQDWKAVAEIMLRSVQALERAGADFVICPDNTIHAALPYVLPR